MNTVVDILSKDVFIVSPKDDLAHVRNLFIKKGISRVLVYDEMPLGMITEKDMSKVFFEERRGIDEIKAEKIMSRGVIIALAEDSPEKIAQIMIKKDISGVPVMSKGTIIGIVTKSDLLKYFAENYAGKIKIGEIMEKAAVIKEFHSIFKAVKIIKNAKTDRLVVLRDKKPVGIISDRDLCLACFGMRPSKIVLLRKAGNGLIHRNIKMYPLIVGDLMKEEIIMIAPEKDAAKGAEIMLSKDIGSLLVCKKGKLNGIVTKTSYAKFLASCI